MNSTFSKIIVLLPVLIIMQACSYAEKRELSMTTPVSVGSSVDDQGEAKEIAKLEIGESLIIDATSDESAREYSVVEAYTAASGRACREVDIRELENSNVVKTAILCQKKSGDWYWPRDVIFK